MQNIMYCAIGCMVGTLVGLLPDSPLATISLPLPLTFSSTTGALDHAGGHLLRRVRRCERHHDEPACEQYVACIDGYQMTLNGKTGLALFTAGVSSHRRHGRDRAARRWPRPWAKWRSCSARPTTAPSCWWASCA
jgi:hypothetical protein